jgi:hypothetical protein
MAVRRDKHSSELGRKTAGRSVLCAGTRTLGYCLLVVRYIPERTVDSLFAAEWIRAQPNAMIWSPSQTLGSADHIVYSASTAGWVIESKAVDRGKGGRWQAPIPRGQLLAYTRLSAPIHYLLPIPPLDLSRPWDRECAGPCCDGPCQFCPRDARSWASLEAAVATAEERLRLQPWFAHWAVVVEASVLLGLLGAFSERIDLEALGAVVNGGVAINLCHWIASKQHVQAPALREYGLDNLPGMYGAVDDPESTPLMFALPPSAA